MFKGICLLLWLLIMALPGVSFGYDKELAKRYVEVFTKMTQRSWQIVSGEQIVEMIKNKEPFVFLDVRTPQEMAFVGIAWKDKLEIPMDRLFRPENLAKLPKDKAIIVVCHTGDRAGAVTAALRALGFENTFQLRGGIVKLATDFGRVLSRQAFE